MLAIHMRKGGGISFIQCLVKFVDSQSYYELHTNWKINEFTNMQGRRLNDNHKSPKSQSKEPLGFCVTNCKADSTAISHLDVMTVYV